MVARGSIVEFPDEALGSLPMHAVVPRLSRTPGAVRRRAPHLDEDAVAVMRELGFSVDPRGTTKQAPSDHTRSP